jgi:NF-kappa-B inhibitor-like protein 1
MSDLHKKRKIDAEEEEGKKLDPIMQDILAAVTTGDVETCSILLNQHGISFCQTTTSDDLQTPLHLAVLHNHPLIINLLLNNGSNINAQDINGDTPAHLAARNSHFSILDKLLQDPNVDIDLTNDKGISVQQLTTTGLDSQDIDDDDGDYKKNSKKFKSIRNRYRYDDDSDYEGLGPPPLPREEREWRQRLLKEIQLDVEMDYREDVLDSWCEEYGGWEDGETEEAFAHRIWREMKKKEIRSSTAFGTKTGTVYETLHSEAEEARKKAKRAAEEEAAKILEEERRKEREWKQAMMEGDLGAKRARYEAAWQFLIARLASQKSPLPLASLGFKDIPWIIPPLQQQQQQQDISSSFKNEIQGVVMYGVYIEEEKRRRLRGELVRWHPDKFKARFDRYLKKEDREKIMDRVDEMTRLLTDILGGGGGSSGG